MLLPIEFQSTTRLAGVERKSKLLAQQSELYQVLEELKTAIRQVYEVNPDRMSLHIEISKNPTDAAFDAKAQSLQNQAISLSNRQSWGYLGKAFVLWTPEVSEYGKTHITIVYFGDFARPTLEIMQDFALAKIEKLA
ncbi:MAG: hypothetical protein MUE85_21810 [Microscillaceae bacterium]|jgi:hypothetical protein|nr:hypothetical protein [Microscillaceae bacterium]